MTGQLLEPRSISAPHEQLWSLVNAGVAARCLQIAAALGVADLLDAEPVPAATLAAACEAHPGSLDRVLRLLAAQGVFVATTAGFLHSPISELLRTDHPRSMRAFAQMMGLSVMQEAFAALELAVRTGAPAIEHVTDGGLWPYLEQHPHEQQVFGMAMTSKAAGDVAAILTAYDFSSASRIVDVGGGRGHLLQAILEATPAASGVLFDLPDVAAQGVEHPRLTRHGGDFFVDALPPGDCYVLMEVVHDWPDEEAVAILSAIARAMTPSAAVLIIENVLDDASPDARGHILDVIMLAVTGGRERTPADLERLLRRAGLATRRVIETDGPLRLVEAIRAHEVEP